MTVMGSNGLCVCIVVTGFIGVVLYHYLQMIGNSNSHFCAHTMAVGRGTTGSKRDKRDTIGSRPQAIHIAVLARHQARHLFFISSTMPKTKVSTKGRKDKAVKRKEGHKINWNPNSAHKGEKLQEWTEDDMKRAFELHAEGKYSQREISRMTGIHVATLNKRLRGLVKGTGHRLGGKRASKVLKEGKRDSQARHSVSRSGFGVSRLCMCMYTGCLSYLFF